MCICYEPETLAASAFLLSYILLKDSLPPLEDDWIEQFNIDWQDEQEVQEVDAVMQGVSHLWTQARSEKIKQAGEEIGQVSVACTYQLQNRGIEKQTEQTSQLRFPS